MKKFVGIIKHLTSIRSWQLKLGLILGFGFSWSLHYLVETVTFWKCFPFKTVKHSWFFLVKPYVYFPHFFLIKEDVSLCFLSRLSQASVSLEHMLMNSCVRNICKINERASSLHVSKPVMTPNFNLSHTVLWFSTSRCGAVCV